MSEKCKYVSIDGTELVFKNNGKLFMGSNNLRDYEYEIYSLNNRIYSFEKSELSQKIFPIYITSADPDFRNYVFSVFEKDVIYKNEHPDTLKTGRIYIGNYYLPGFVYASSNGNYLIQCKNLKKNLNFVTNAKAWIKEEEFVFAASDSLTDDGLKFPFDYSHDYGTSISSNSFKNQALSKSNFILQISGPVCSPAITINDNVYNVDVVVDENEFLTIDSMNGVVYLTKADGRTVNCFDERNREYDIFTKIDTGLNQLVYDRSIKFKITLLIERSEPEWI